MSRCSCRLGLGERLEHRAEQLSMGERQRVMIARALSTEPKLVLADEPTGSLDSERGREVLDAVERALPRARIAVLLVTHDPRGGPTPTVSTRCATDGSPTIEPDVGLASASAQ